MTHLPAPQTEVAFLAENTEQELEPRRRILGRPAATVRVVERYEIAEAAERGGVGVDDLRRLVELGILVPNKCRALGSQNSQNDARRASAGAGEHTGRQSAWEADTLPTELLPLGRGKSLAQRPVGLK